MASAELAVDNKSDQTPLARERQHAQDEREGRLRFVVVKNDGLDRSLISLIDMKSIYSKQLPKMGKEYIVRLVLDRSHTSLACVFEGEIVGGVTYRRHATQAFAEIAFCAVSATHQVRGYGTRLMNQLKEHCKREGIHFLLTYADNHAIGYFRKQGFQKQVTMKRERWLGYIKDYDGGTLMECAIDTQVDYLNIRFVAEEQRRAIAERMEAGGAQQQEAEYAGYDPAEGGVPAGLQGTSWRESALHCSMQGKPVPLADCLQAVLAEVATHADAWPFQTAVSTSLAPDYYEVIKDPVDLASVRARLTPRAHLHTTTRSSSSSPTCCACAKTAACTTATTTSTTTARSGWRRSSGRRSER
ncbi:hypothetical protein EMIHUDRAFT_427509 [Emiliania huxleyi CCMP1516]|uniref:Histone acetyltransferase n=2 Tax=Emiliania huxleyi TaxID=2903 RepID=A0A0D3J067_EMIH1|nr:hypothetical protein EMIHUDRAFT_427509 [Emiliania huxleyi CCMP1516]EOD16902.1 hypothetical protein EMIHUDRAFT_427509 [Emiliania huxleyi CCMP1516]|eukprot:XP_005769331.1 hypothetical protein EMIHUDRAFT_427509 [Emiliania huxleyi CCMP1516]